MRLQLKAVRDNPNDGVKTYAEKRLRKLGRRLYDQTLVEVTLSRERNPSIRDDHWAEAIVHTKGPNIVARGSGQTYEAAIDILVEKLERQVERYRDKRKLEPRRTAQKKGAPPPLPPEPEAPGEEGEAAA
jgi:putative sigma-54 modulation protein